MRALTSDRLRRSCPKTPQLASDPCRILLCSYRQTQCLCQEAAVAYIRRSHSSCLFPQLSPHIGSSLLCISITASTVAIKILNACCFNWTRQLLHSKAALSQIVVSVIQHISSIHHAFPTIEKFLADLFDNTNIIILWCPRHYLLKFQIIKTPYNPNSFFLKLIRTFPHLQKPQSHAFGYRSTGDNSLPFR